MKDIVIMMIGNSYSMRVADERAQAILSVVERACEERKAIWLDLNEGNRRAKLMVHQITGYYVQDHTESATTKLIRMQTEMSEEVLRKLKDGGDDADSWKKG